MNTLERWELAIRLCGFVLLGIAWVSALAGASGSRHQPSGRSSGLARWLPSHLVYLLGAIPYFTICIVLWRRIPIDLGTAARIICLTLGAALGTAGAIAYLWGRRTLGAMYNVSSSLGSELYENHVLIRTGPYAYVRHPMYVGLMLAAAGGLLVYRTWTLVFMVATLAGAVFKARREERLLAEELGDAWAAYAERVPAWLPRLASAPREEVNDDRPAPATA